MLVIIFANFLDAMVRSRQLLWVLLSPPPPSSSLTPKITAIRFIMPTTSRALTSLWHIRDTYKITSVDLLASQFSILPASLFIAYPEFWADDVPNAHVNINLRHKLELMVLRNFMFPDFPHIFGKDLQA